MGDRQVRGDEADELARTLNRSVAGRYSRPGFGTAKLGPILRPRASDDPQIVANGDLHRLIPVGIVHKPQREVVLELKDDLLRVR